MQIIIKGKHLDIGTALQSHVNDHLGQVVQKYFDRAQEAHVTIAKESYQFIADLTVHVPGMILSAHGAAEDAYTAFDQATSKLASRLRRHKSRIKNHHQKEPAKAQYVLQQILAAPADDENAEVSSSTGDEKPLIIAETHTAIETLSVMDAVARLDLTDIPALLFTNPKTGQLNMVYRRRDGHISWVDPSQAKAA